MLTLPLAAAAEQTAAHWLIDLLGLANGTSVGFVTGGTMANFTGIASEDMRCFRNSVGM
jgi:glutamate/tyrosine decarboxylase-like PLP-dependent enzyme